MQLAVLFMHAFLSINWPHVTTLHKLRPGQAADEWHET